MRHVRLLLTGLDSDIQGLTALSALLARGRPIAGDYTQSPSQRLARLFAPKDGSPIALAPARMAFDGLRRDEPGWLCADPVHLRLMRDHILLGDAHTFDLGADEAEALIHALNVHFTGSIEFIAGAPDRWYARFAQALPSAPLAPLDSRLARPVEARGDDSPAARDLAPLLTEVQMVLHAHSVNQAREARGDAPINSVWLWGNGAPGQPRAPAERMLADGILGRSLARAAYIPIGEVDAGATFLSTAVPETLICIEALHAPARYGQTEILRERLLALEHRLFAPLLDALRHGRLDALDIEVLGSGGFGRRLGRLDAWKFWRR